MKTLVAVAVLAALVMCGTPGARAAGGSNDKSPQASKSEKKPTRVPFHGRVAAVDSIAKVITLEGNGKGRPLQITSETKITKDGKPAVLNDVIVGESVGGAYKEDAAGKLDVVTLNIGAKPGKEKGGEKRREKK